MRVRSSIIWFCVAIIVLIALIIWHCGKGPITISKAVSDETNVASPVTVISSVPTNVLARANVSVTKPGTATTPTVITTSSDKDERAIGLLSTYNDVPIDFYGRLQDQFSNAVTGATISFGVRIFNGNESTVKNGQVESDSNGFFTISGYQGQDLSIAPQKPGYVLAATSTLFKYSHLEDNPFVSDPSNPTVIKMWKLHGGEPLLSINQRYKFHFADAPINFDLITGEIVLAGGDVEITVARSSGDITGRTRQDWSVHIEAVDGGLIESSGDEIAYEAPANGYHQSDDFVMSTNAPHKWLGGFDQTFFLQSRHGQVYSKINFGISINQYPDDYIWVEFHGIANTNGSRNWEATAPQ
jgi:hypothetical protein